LVLLLALLLLANLEQDDEDQRFAVMGASARASADRDMNKRLRCLLDEKRVIREDNFWSPDGES
jgi:hypothetical protein